MFRDLRWGVYVTFAAEHEYVRRCFQEYGIVTDPSGEYAAMYKPSHLIGLELGISVASVALRREPTGCATRLARRLRRHREARAEGGRGARRRGRLHRVGQAHGRAPTPPRARALPIGLAHKVKLKRDIAEGATLRWDDVDVRRVLASGADSPGDGTSFGAASDAQSLGTRMNAMKRRYRHTDVNRASIEYHIVAWFHRGSARHRVIGVPRFGSLAPRRSSPRSE